MDDTWEITFTLAAGFDEEDAIDLYEYIETHKSVDAAVLCGPGGGRVQPRDSAPPRKQRDAEWLI